MKHKAVIWLISLLVASSACAHDSDRIEQLQIEVDALKQRLSELEALLTDTTQGPAVVPSIEGWRSVENWRTLRTGMSPDEVHQVLGKPHRVEVGFYFTVWDYRNGGRVNFVDKGLAEWREPRQ